MADHPQRPPEAPTAPPDAPAVASVPLWPTGWGWSRRHLAVLAVMLVALGALVAWRVVRNRAYVRPDLEVSDSRLAPAGEKIDPNTASWASLARLPGLGQAKAKAVVEYRRQWVQEHPGRQAFLEASDLQKVAGIGPTIVEQATPFLTFPADGEGTGNKEQATRSAEQGTGEKR